MALLGPLCARSAANHPDVLVGVRPEVAELGCFFTDGPVALEAEVFLYPYP